MTELREKMIRQMELRNLSENTQRSYLQTVYGLAKHYMQSPDKMTKEMIEDYLLYLKKEKGNALTTVGSAITGMRFFYNHVLGDEQLSPSCSFAKTPRKLPTVLSQEEIWSIINATGNIKHRLLLMTIYSAGLRASEVLPLKSEHIDSKRMLIKVNGKGGKQRYTAITIKHASREHIYSLRPINVKSPECYLTNRSAQSTKTPGKRLVSKEARGYIPFGTRSPPTSWKPATTFVRYRCLWATHGLPQP